MKNISKFKILKTVALLLTNTSAVLYFWFYLNGTFFTFSALLLVLLNSILIKKQNTSSSLFSSFLKKQYFKTKFRILNNLDNKKSIKKIFIATANKAYLKILFYLILIFKNSEAGYLVVREDMFNLSELLSAKIKPDQESVILDTLHIVRKIKNKKELKWNEVQKLDQVLLSLYKQKQQKFTRFSAGTITLLIIATSTTSLISSLILSGVSNLKAATYGWVQTDWSAGADELATANHQNDQTGWTKLYSKDNTVDTSTSGELSITSTEVAITDTTDDDFNNTTMTNNSGGFYISSGVIHLKKQAGASCVDNEECVGSCINLVCEDYLLGPCSGIAVRMSDIQEKKAWKVTASDCTSPQCMSGNLVADNSVDFSQYPARDACKSLGGRLPTEDELSCIYENRLVYGNNFPEGFYYSNHMGWSSMFGYIAYGTNFTNGAVGSGMVTSPASVRCVRDL